MQYGEVKDIVREHVGRDRLGEDALNWAIQRGLREIEKSGNWYWMEAIKPFNLVINQQGYSIYTSAGGGLNISDFKDSRILVVQDATLPNPDWDEVFGPESIEEVKLEFATTDTGMPITWTIADGFNDAVLNVWPPKPDKTYAMELHYYQWTQLSTDSVNNAHEILKRWPEALIYLATEQAMIIATKDLNAGAFWRNLYSNPNSQSYGGNDEFHKLQRYNVQRSNSSRWELRPRTGGLTSRRRRWRRTREIWI